MANQETLVLIAGELSPSVRLRAGATLWIPTEDAGEAELFALFGILIRQEAKYYRVGGGLGGRVLITEDLKYNDRIVSQFEAAADFGAGKVRPGLLLRWPLESVVRGVITDPIFGLKLDVRL